MITAAPDVFPQSTTFSTADPDAAASFLESACGVQGRVDGLLPNRPMTVSGMTMGRASVGTAELPSALDFESEPWPFYIVTQLKSGSLRYGGNSRAETCSAGDVVLSVRAGRPCRAQTVDAAISLTIVAPAALRQITGDAAADGRPGVRFLSGRARSATAAAQWQTAVDYVTTTLQGCAGARDAELVVGGAVRLLATTLLHVFPNTYVDAERTEEQPDPGCSPILRRAVDYIHANCARDIAMADIASAVNVTPRAVQYMFRRHLGTTPMAYLRQVRLDRARHDLLAADPACDTVSGIATRWGFAHIGRFSQVYRVEFGESPSVTLRG